MFQKTVLRTALSLKFVNLNIGNCLGFRYWDLGFEVARLGIGLVQLIFLSFCDEVDPGYPEDLRSLRLVAARVAQDFFDVVFLNVFQGFERHLQRPCIRLRLMNPQENSGAAISF